MVDAHRLTSGNVQNSRLQVVLYGLALIALISPPPALGEGIGGFSGLGPTPTGLAPGAFSAFEPVRVPATRIDAVSVSTRPAVGGPPTAWRPLSPSERGQATPVDADLFPHSRQAVPLLVPDASDVTSSLPSAPSRAMTGPSVGVRWRIPGHTR